MSNIAKLENKNISLVNQLDQELKKVFSSDYFPTFQSLLNDEKKLINWEEIVEDRNYPGKFLIGGVLYSIPPFEIPILNQSSLTALEATKIKIKNRVMPLSFSKDNIPEHLELFKNNIFLLINAFPTYTKKDNEFKKDTVLSYLSFLEDLPVLSITKAISEWVKTQTTFPTIAELRKLAIIDYSIFKKKLERIEKLISKIK